MSSVLALLVLLIGLVCFAFANGRGLVAANASTDDPYNLGTKDIWDAEWQRPSDSIWNIPSFYGSNPAEEVAPDLPPVRITSNASLVAPGGRVEFEITKEDCPKRTAIYIQVPPELTNVSILGYVNGADTPFFDFAKDIGYESPRYYLPEFSMYRIMSEHVERDPRFGYGLNDNGEYVRYHGWDFNPPHDIDQYWRAEKLPLKSVVTSQKISISARNFEFAQRYRLRMKTLIIWNGWNGEVSWRFRLLLLRPHLSP